MLVRVGLWAPKSSVGWGWIENVALMRPWNVIEDSLVPHHGHTLECNGTDASRVVLTT